MNCRETIDSTALVAVLLSLSMTLPAFAQPAQLRPSNEEQSALRAAADRVADSIVRIETLNAEGRLVGSGTIVDAAGYVVAADERIGESPTGILVTLPDGERTAGTIISRDHSRGLVLLQIDAEQQLAAIDLAQSAAARIGQWTIAAGRPFDSETPMVSIGILSALERNYGRALQTDARVSPGLYGGPLLDAHGNVLGITVPVVGDGITAGDFYDSGIGFAVPLEQIAARLSQLREGKEIYQGKLGIVTQGDPYAEGTKLSGVRPQSPAAKAGLQTGDTIEEIGGTPVERMVHVRQTLGARDAGEVVTLTISRPGTDTPQQIDVELAESIPPYKPLEIGALASDGSGNPVIDAVMEDGPANAAGLQAKDVILGIAGIDVATVEEARLQIQMREPEQPTELRIRRGETEQQLRVAPRFVPAELPTLPRVDENDAAAEWGIEDLDLPGEESKVRLLAPTQGAELEGLGLLVLVPDPKQEGLDALLEARRAAAEKAGIVLAAVGSIDRQRWTPSEVETLVHVATSVRKQYDIRPDRVAIVGVGGGATMALFTGFSKRDAFRGIAVDEDVTVPPLRLQPADPAEMVRVLVQLKTSDEQPGWTAPLKQLGYPVQQSRADRHDQLMQWNRLLGGL